MLSWIFTTLSDSLQARLVVARPKSANEAWDLITGIVKDNKRPRTNALKAELRSIKLGDLSMEAYFTKIESIVTILTTLNAHINDEDVVHFAINDLSDKYDQVCGIMHHKDTFPDLKIARSMLITEEMRLKSKSLALLVDSSSASPMVLLVEAGTSHCPSSSQTKSWRPCFNFAKGSCRFGESCKYVHAAQANPSTNSRASNIVGNGSSNNNTTNDLLLKLIDKIRTLGFLTMSAHSPLAYPAHGPPGFPSAQPSFSGLTAQPTGKPNSQPDWQPNGQSAGLMGPTGLPGQATTLPNAFNAVTLQDLVNGAWNMDTSARLRDSTGASLM
ncbi:ribonuclease H-like domain-containing protein [Tanacetum coccineum]